MHQYLDWILEMLNAHSPILILVYIAYVIAFEAFIRRSYSCHREGSHFVIRLWFDPQQIIIQICSPGGSNKKVSCTMMTRPKKTILVSSQSTGVS